MPEGFSHWLGGEPLRKKEKKNKKEKKKEERLGKCAKIVSVPSKGLICEKLNCAYIYPLHVTKLACYKS